MSIYSRLKNASKYTMFIDDSENKQDFYQQLKEFINPTLPFRTVNNDVYKLEEEINEILETLDKSVDLLYNKSIKMCRFLNFFSIKDMLKIKMSLMI